MEKSALIPELEQMLDVSWQLEPAGIYFLLKKGEVQYVGKSTNVAVRVAHHRANLIRHRRGLPEKSPMPLPLVDFDQVRVLLCDRDELAAQEIHWIQRLNPPANTLLNRAVKFDLKKHAFFSDLMDLGVVRLRKDKEIGRLRPVSALRSRPIDTILNRYRLIRSVQPSTSSHA